MTNRRSEYFINGVDYDWHKGSKLNIAVKQFHDRYLQYINVHLGFISVFVSSSTMNTLAWERLVLYTVTTRMLQSSDCLL